MENAESDFSYTGKQENFLHIGDRNVSHVYAEGKFGGMEINLPAWADGSKKASLLFGKRVL